MTVTIDLRRLAEARWPEPGDPDAPAVAGFVVSSFNPLVAAVAERCLNRCGPAHPARTAVIVVSARGDLVSAVHVADAVDRGARVGPLMFFQSVPNAIAGHVAARWGLCGPVVCLSPAGDPLDEGLAEAALLIDDGDADEALVVVVEQAVDGEPDNARAVLVRGVRG